ncbi:SDR family NAD(P)-dependent oxidoreductase [Phenylobacterium sp.]|uniref:SDR family NAD(P)-dependent oxidoreductase n=1 Tax=Phenylobacterium sp. TaxID=1871053 RepID=UPI00289B5599|nr:SDR family NAD(P)-dependent oxidoreductase [Phenylobacterium sp.]
MSQSSLADGPAGSVLIAGVGAERGLGAALARRFGRAGFPVALAGRNAEKLRATERALLAEGLQVAAVVGDASQAADARRFVEAAQALAPLAAAIHNAGSNRPTPFLDLAESDFEAHWREHALGGFQVAQAALPALLELRGKANFAPFASAKGALRNLSQSLAREFGPQGVHVAHVVIDGGIEGERLLSRVPQLKEQRGPDGLLNIDAIAQAYFVLHQQHRSAWTLELDLRPWAEAF